MKGLKYFDINIYNLRDNTVDYTFEINDAFDDYYGFELFKGTGIKIDVHADRLDTHIEMRFVINGNIILTCDRSLEEFDYSLEITEKIIFKYGDEARELGENIFEIPNEQLTINVAQYIYDLIGVSIPIRKIHPRFKEDELEEEEGELIYSTGEGYIDESADDEDEDPRWDALKKKN